MINLSCCLLLITEIMFDPTPRVGLPESEYIEIYNPGNDTIDLSHWQLRIGDRMVTLTRQGGAGNGFPPGYCILTAAKQEDLFTPFGLVIPLSSWPALSNTGARVSLIDPGGRLIHSVDYNPGWITDAWKANGGWAVEMIDTHRWGHSGNWTASLDPSGGTPGRTNSVAGFLEDEDPVTALRLFPHGSTQLGCLFSGSLHPLMVSDSLSLILHPGGHRCDRIESNEFGLDILLFSLPRNLDPALRYKSRFGGVLFDYAGREVSGGSLLFAFHGLPKYGDLVINEVMFDPGAGASEFVEIYNCGEAVFDLSVLTLLRGSPDLPGTASAWSEGASLSYLLFPGSCALMPRIPSLPNGGGWLALMTESNDLLDQMVYRPDFHHPLIRDRSGISLERIDPYGSGMEAASWHSSADPAGSTPGAINSIALAESRDHHPSTGTEDPVVFRILTQGSHVIIAYHTDEPGWYGRILLFDRQGVQVATLREPGLLERSGTVLWNGLDQNATSMAPGIYLVLAEWYQSNGKRGRWKRGCFFSGSLP